MDRIDQQPAPPTPVTEDAQATAAELQQRAAQDYATAQTARAQQTNRRGN